MDKQRLNFTVNGEEQELWIVPNRTLLEVLREDLLLTGSKESCGEGTCGSCTVLLDGLPVRSCLLPAMEAGGRDVTTVEGLAEAIARAVAAMDPSLVLFGLSTLKLR